MKLNEGKHNYEDCKVYYYSSMENKLIKREEKNEFLKGNDILSINLEELQIADFERQLNQTRWIDNFKDKFKTEDFGFYFFIKKDINDIMEYGNGIWLIFYEGFYHVWYCSYVKKIPTRPEETNKWYKKFSDKREAMKYGYGLIEKISMEFNVIIEYGIMEVNNDYWKLIKKEL